ncbi:MAG: rRNA maturation RNase YbeY [Thermodesulfovibrionales bacterium]
MTVSIRNAQRRVAIDVGRLRRDASFLLDALGQTSCELSILISNDETMKDLNARYRGKPYTTDVLSFPLGSAAQNIPGADVLLGDIVVNAHLAARSSRESGRALYLEIRRLLVHGVLHLVGYDHENGPSESRRMSRKEQRLLDALAKMD